MNCLNCNTETSNPKFCCQSCNTSYQNRTIKRVQKTQIIYQQNPKFCKFCNTEIPYIKRNSNFCNHSCSAIYNNSRRNVHKKSNTTTLKINATELFFQGKLTTSRALRKQLIIERGNTCEVCKVSGTCWVGKPLTLQVDHIDGNADNNNPTNLRLLCPNCHSQTENFGSKNKGTTHTRNKYRIMYRNSVISESNR